MGIKKYLTLCLLMLFSICLFAQNETTNAFEEINAIKADSRYLYAESTNADWEVAYDNARTILAGNIEDWLREEKKNEDISGVVTKAANVALQIKARRGKLYRIFVYVKKDDLVAFNEDNSIMLLNLNKEIKNVVENKEPVAQKQERQKELVTTVSSVQVSNPQKEEVAVSEPAPQSEKKVVKEATVQPQAAMILTEDEKNLVKIVDATDIESFVKDLQSKNKIEKFGQYKTMPQDTTVYLLVYNTNKQVVAHLLKNASGYLNLNTGKGDDITNYKGCGAFWILYKK